MEDGEIVNRVSNSSLVTLNLEDFHPGDVIRELDLKELLFQGLILREKDLRDFIRTHDFTPYRDKHVAIFCSADAVIPTWAYMLLSIALQPFARSIVFGTKDELVAKLYDAMLDTVDWEKYTNAKVVIKGCSDVHVPESAYVKAAAKLRPLASSIMYGEPCSTVPLYKRTK